MLTIYMASNHVIYNIFGYWLGYVFYMSAKVEIQFPPRSGGGIKRKSDRRISKLDSKRGFGDGRGRSHGQGCGGHHYVSNMYYSVNGWFHGVDCSDFRRCFFGKEFDKVGSDGSLYEFSKRKSEKKTRHINKFQQGGKYDGREITLVPYYGLATGNNKSWGDENTKESKEHILAQGKGGQAGRRFGQDVYKKNYKS